MALPSSGQISVSQIRTELTSSGRNNYSFSEQMEPSFAAGANSGMTPVNQSSTSKPNPTNSDPISEWYSYDHTSFNSCGSTYNLVVGSCLRTYRIIEISGTSGNTSFLSVTGDGNNSSYSYRIYDVYPFTNTGAFVGTSPIFSGTLSTITTDYTYILAGSSIKLHFVAYQNDCA